MTVEATDRLNNGRALFESFIYLESCWRIGGVTGGRKVTFPLNDAARRRIYLYCFFVPGWETIFESQCIKL